MAVSEKIQLVKSIQRINELLNSSRKLHKILEEVLEVVRKVFNADICIFYEYDSKSDTILFPIFRGEIKYESPIINRPEKLAFDVVYNILNRGKSYFTENSQSDDIMSGKVIQKIIGVEESFTFRENIHSSCGILLKYRKEILGVLFFNYRWPKKFTTEDKQLMELLSSYVVLAYRNARRKDDLIKRLAFNSSEIHNIRKIVRDPKKGHSEKKIIYKVLNDILKFFGETLGYYAKYDKKSEKVIIHVASKQYASIVDTSWSVNEGITGEAIRLREPIIVPNIHAIGSKMLIFSRGDVEELITDIDKDIKSCITVPLIIKHEVIGVFHIESKNYNNFSRYDEDNFKSLVEFAADSIENIRLIKQNNLYHEKVKKIHEIDKLIVSRLNVDSLLKNIITTLNKLIKAKINRSHFFLIIKDDKGELILRQFPRSSNSHLQFSINNNGKVSPYSIYSHPTKHTEFIKTGTKGIMRLAIQNNKTINTNDSDSLWKEYYMPVVEGIRSELAVPIRLRGNPMGVINLESEELKAFDKEDVEIIETFAGQASILLLMNKLIIDMKLLELKSLSLSKQSFTKLILSKGIELLGADAGAIWLYSAQDSQLNFGSYLGFNDNIWDGRNYDLNNSLIGSIIQKKRIKLVKVKDYLQSTSESIMNNFIILKENGIGSFISVPFVSNDNSIAIMNLYFRDEFDERLWIDTWEKSIMEIFANQVAVALQNFYLFNELNDSVPIKIFDMMKKMLMFTTHSLNNHVGSIRADSMDLLENSDRFDEETKRLINSIFDQSEYALTIPKQLGDFTKGIRTEKSFIDIYKIIEIVFKKVKIYNIDINYEQIKASPLVWANQEFMKEIFIELTKNASKAMPKGGKITITSKVKNPQILAISFKDTGHGISKENLNKIFDYGFTWWPNSRSKGDGLSLIKVVIESEFKGKIYVSNVSNSGTEFIVELPIYNKSKKS